MARYDRSSGRKRMSQHYFNTLTQDGEPVSVLMGWDRPLGHFFLVVEKDTDDDEYLYSNLDDPQALFNRPLSYYREKLAILGIDVPDSMFVEIERDKAMNTGNRYVWHRPDGTFEER